MIDPLDDQDSIQRMLERELAFANEAFLILRPESAAPAWRSVKTLLAAHDEVSACGD